MEEKLLTVDDLAKRTGLSKQYFRQGRTIEKKEGRNESAPRIPVMTLVGNRLRCREEDYQEWLLAWRGKRAREKIIPSGITGV